MPSIDEERFSCLQLYRTKRVGAATFRSFIKRFGSAKNAIDRLPDITGQYGKRLQAATREVIEQELDASIKVGAQLLIFDDDAFPKGFSAIPMLPPILFARGDVSLLQQPGIAIVGARVALPISLRFTRRMAQKLGERHKIIISGLAMGVDASAHEGSLATGTIAVVAGGVDVPYPTQNTDLYNRICSQGCVVSEMPMGTKPSARLFPIRNRIIAGLCTALLVIEAERRSGSLITANFAADMGKHVFAVPGHPTDGKFRGCNALIKDGAELVETPEDILSSIETLNFGSVNVGKFTEKTSRISPSTNTSPENTSPSTNKAAEAILRDEETKRIAREVTTLLKTTSMNIDALIQHTNISPSHIKAVLLEMELSEILTISTAGICTLL